jgi:hypothetical protein
MPMLLNFVRWACVIAYCNIANYAFFWYDKREARQSSRARTGDMEFAPRLTVGTNGVNPRSFTRTGDRRDVSKDPKKTIYTKDSFCC